MEDAEKDVKYQIRKLNMMMRNYSPPQLTDGTVDFHKSQMDKIQAIFEDLILSIEDMCDDFQSEMETAGKLESWKGLIPTIEKDFRDYSMRFYPILEQLKSATRSGSGSIYSSFQEEQLKLLREQIEISKRKLDETANETLREIDIKKSVAIKKVKAKKEHILSEVEVLGEEVNKVGYWEDEGNLEVSRAMRNIAVWKKKLEERIGVGGSDSQDNSEEFEIANILDRSWLQCEDCAEEMPDSSDTSFHEYEYEIDDHVEQNESVMSLLYVVDNDMVGDLYLQLCPGFDN